MARYYRAKRKRTTTYRRRRRPWYSKKYSVAQLATKALKGVSYLKGLVNAELHKKDLNSLSGTVPNTGSINNLCQIAQGDNDGERTGNSLLLRYVNISGVVNRDSTNTSPSSHVRFMLFIDTQQVPDTPPTAADLLQVTSSSAAPFSKLNKLSVGRYRILTSRLVSVDSGNPSRLFNLKLNMRHHVRYNGVASTDIQKGAIYFLAISGDATQPPGVVWTSRISYYDN